MRHLKTTTVMSAMILLTCALQAQDGWKVPEEHISPTYARYFNQEAKQHGAAALLDLTEKQARHLVPRYAHQINSISPVSGSRSQSWTYDPLKDPDHIYEGSYYVVTKRNLNRFEDMPTKGRRQLVIATVKGNTKKFFVRLFDNDTDKYKDYTLKQRDFKDELTMLEAYRWKEHRINHKWAGFQVLRLQAKIVAKTRHTLGKPMGFPQTKPGDSYFENQSVTVMVHFGKTVDIPYYKDGAGKKYFLSCALDRARWEWALHQFRFHSVKSRWLKEKAAKKKKRYERVLTAFAESYADVLPLLAVSNGLAPLNLGKDKGGMRDTRYALPEWVLNDMVLLLDEHAPDWFNAKRPGQGDLTQGQYLAQQVLTTALEFFTVNHKPVIQEASNVDIYGIGSLTRAGARYGVDAVGWWSLRTMKRARKRHEVTADGLGPEGAGYYHLWRTQIMLALNAPLRNAKKFHDPKLRKAIDDMIDDPHLFRQAISYYGDVFPSGDHMLHGMAHYKYVRPINRPLVYHTSRNTAMPASGLFRMGDGEGDKQVQTVLFNGPACNHSHDDILNLQLYANGCPLFYDNSEYGSRPLSKHNTVAFDRRDYTPRKSAAEFDFFAPSMPGIAAVRMSRLLEEQMNYVKAERIPKHLARPEVPLHVKAYERTLINNTIDIDHPYVVDVFEVEGGKFHEYFLHGMNVRDMQPARDGVSPSLKKHLDTKSVKSHTNRWGVKVSGYTNQSILPYKNCVSTLLKEDGWVDFRFIDNPSEGVRIHLQKNLAMKLWVADHQYSDKRVKVLRDTDYPQLVLEHGDSELKTQKTCRTIFVAVHEPLKGESVIQSFSHREINNGKALAIEVKTKDGRTDRYLVSMGQTQSMSDGKMTAVAQLAASTQKKGKSDLWLVSGESVSMAGKTLKAHEPDLDNAKILEITAEEKYGEENSILTDTALPLGNTLAGQFVIIRFSDPVKNLRGSTKKEQVQNYFKRNWAFKRTSALHRAFEIDHVRKEGGNYRIALRDYTNVAWMEKERHWEFQFLPHFAFRKAELLFKNQASTVPALSYTPRKGYDPDAANNFLSVPESNLNLTVTTRPAGAPVVITLDGSLPTAKSTKVRDGKVTLTQSGPVRLMALNPDGVMRPRSIAADYRLGLWPDKSVEKSNLKPGLSMDLLGKKPESRVVEQVYFSKYPMKNQRFAKVHGYIDIPKSGMIEFGFLSQPSSETRKHKGTAAVFIDGERIIDMRRLWGNARRRVKVALKKGLHELRIDAHEQEMRFYWKLPGGGKMVPVPKNAFYYDSGH